MNVRNTQAPVVANDAFVEELFHTYRLPLVRLAILLTGDRGCAEDLVQEAFAGLTRNLSGLRSTDAAAGYLRTATVNNCRSYMRRKVLARRHPARTDADRGGDTVLDAVLLAEEHREIVALLPSLSQRQREVLVLRYWSGFSEAQIAETLGVSTGTVKTTSSRALAKLSRKAGTP